MTRITACSLKCFIDNGQNVFRNEDSGMGHGRTHTFWELLKLLKISDCVDKIDIQRESFAFYIPSIVVMFDFDQRNHAHQYDLWHHCLYTVLNLPRNMDDDMLYLAALLHDIGRPDCQCRGYAREIPICITMVILIAVWRSFVIM